MKNVRLTMSLKQWGIVAGGLVALVGAAAMAFQPSAHRASAVQVDQTTAVQSTDGQSDDRKQVIVNGQVMPTDEDGNTKVTVPGSGNTTVEVSGNTTTVKTQDNQPKQSSETNSGSTSVSMTSTNNGGTSFGSTHVFGSSFSSTDNGSSQSFKSTQVFSTDSANVHVTP